MLKKAKRIEMVASKSNEDSQSEDGVLSVSRSRTTSMNPSYKGFRKSRTHKSGSETSSINTNGNSTTEEEDEENSDDGYNSSPHGSKSYTPRQSSSQYDDDVSDDSRSSGDRDENYDESRSKKHKNR
eukprot:UN16115